MALAVATVRQRVAAALEALTGWSESVQTPGRYGKDAQTIQHQGFSVAVVESRVHSREGRQRLSQGALMESTVEVQWAYGLAVDDRVADYDAALGAEQTAIQAVLAISRADLHIALIGMTRQPMAAEYVTGTIRFRAIHQYALA